MENNTTEYDVVIVGSGIGGSIVAKTLSQAGKKVLLLEAGLEAGMSFQKKEAFDNYMGYLNTFYEKAAKVPNSPYPNLKDAPSPDVLDIEPITACQPSTKGYLVQAGPLPFGSDAWRGPGGTTMHWLGSTPRMLPNDFRMKTLYGVGVDWPFDYNTLKPYYEMAEFEIGVSGSVSEQKGPDVDVERDYGENYQFPMKKVPQSYLDKQVIESVPSGFKVFFNGKEHELQFVSTPQGRNSIPNADYPYADIVWNKSSGKLQLQAEKRWNTFTKAYEHVEQRHATYSPVGAVWDDHQGHRCEGNASCVPICPVQAKYNALKTLRKSDPKHIAIRTRSVASKVLTNEETGEVTGIVYKKYENPSSSVFESHVAKGKIYVLAANAIENAKLLLASGIANSSDQVGRNLMDHMVMLTWGLLPKKAYPFRGPGSTTNIPTMRDGEFRKDHAACISPIDNWGWGWPKFSPGSDVENAVAQGMFGESLRNHIHHIVPRQLLLHFECEQTPEPENRVTIDPNYLDNLGNYRPVIHYSASDYMKKAFAEYKKVSDQIFKAAGVQDFTEYTTDNPDHVEYQGKVYNFWGAGHIVGTHRMGNNSKDSVVNENGQTWDHNNLYLVGCGNMPTLGTSNPTLTMSALAFKTSEAILNHLNS
ncbi:GMC family oxidoreductase [Roseivirga thermotolerans]|uniref:Dehydrogenase n=1 Tax=Roseivirga thermotolerans TaxID=1758176 RepID=A0ABQ3IAG4_9BACT|nr:GMC family oxidoreductase [Roseivirga thermotolerans]GHE70176.1 dehydrogenase [Roseivirga thermotolerans]